MGLVKGENRSWKERLGEESGDKIEGGIRHLLLLLENYSCNISFLASTVPSSSTLSARDNPRADTKNFQETGIDNRSIGQSQSDVYIFSSSS